MGEILHISELDLRSDILSPLTCVGPDINTAGFQPNLKTHDMRQVSNKLRDSS